MCNYNFDQNAQLDHANNVVQVISFVTAMVIDRTANVPTFPLDHRAQIAKKLIAPPGSQVPYTG